MIFANLPCTRAIARDRAISRQGPFAPPWRGRRHRRRHRWRPRRRERRGADLRCYRAALQQQGTTP